MLFALAAVIGTCADSRCAGQETELGTEGYATSGDVKIHYVTKGEGPLVILIHGFPDYWYTWRKQIPTLAES
ncbi:MAG: alpha/beta hydrolase, partial [Planctomycetota bacterium]